ncbi:hypothetical protein [Frankia sp. QA3]|uniref:hypothetical protein n=1 Tax=Frankia sp. QA3 TaxID=710111 RepID=UPI000269C833|nr:hypothetical protein [Frankia sp. QA3]EIV94582.1 hypothetical protein FraQA3DRAFT_4342 [Frankia sp. QA3]
MGVAVVLTVIVVCLGQGWLSQGELVVAVALDLLHGLLLTRGAVSAGTDGGDPPAKETPDSTP